MRTPGSYQSRGFASRFADRRSPRARSPGSRDWLKRASNRGDNRGAPSPVSQFLKDRSTDLFSRRGWAERHAPRANIAARNRRSTKLTTARTCRTRGVLRSAPAPVMTAIAQRKSPVHAPSPSCHAAQNPPPCCAGMTLRRSISALTGPGGHATDHPRTNPLMSVALSIAGIILPVKRPGFSWQEWRVPNRRLIKRAVWKPRLLG